MWERTNTVSTLSDLVPGALYAVCGEGQNLEMLPPQVFRFEKLIGGLTGDKLVAGTLWWRVWSYRWFSGVQRDHWFAQHHIGIGQTNGLHDFHLERLERKDVPKFLGRGRLYEEFLQDSRPSTLSRA